MIESIAAVLHLLLSSLGVATATDPSSAVIASVAIIALAVIAVALHARWLPGTPAPAASAPRRVIGVSVLLAQSDPDAAGHSRPRAPGFAASAA